jgi:hypothetical protein
MKPSRYWLSFDLGVRGDYEALYEWLDALDAKECGDSVATFLSPNTHEEIAEELSQVSRPVQHYRALSLTDRVLRRVLASADTRLDLFITFNPRDFVDVCRRVVLRMVS